MVDSQDYIGRRETKISIFWFAQVLSSLVSSLVSWLIHQYHTVLNHHSPVLSIVEHQVSNVSRATTGGTSCRRDRKLQVWARVRRDAVPLRVLRHRHSVLARRKGMRVDFLPCVLAFLIALALGIISCFHGKNVSYMKLVIKHAYFVHVPLTPVSVPSPCPC